MKRRSGRIQWPPAYAEAGYLEGDTLTLVKTNGKMIEFVTQRGNAVVSTVVHADSKNLFVSIGGQLYGGPALREDVALALRQAGHTI